MNIIKINLLKHIDINVLLFVELYFVAPQVIDNKTADNNRLQATKQTHLCMYLYLIINMFNENCV